MGENNMNGMSIPVGQKCCSCVLYTPISRGAL